MKSKFDFRRKDMNKVTSIFVLYHRSYFPDERYMEKSPPFAFEQISFTFANPYKCSKLNELVPLLMLKCQ